MNDIPRAFLVILRLFGIYPLQENVYKCYGLMLMAASTYCFISATQMKESDSFADYHDLVTLSDEVFTFFLTITSVTSILVITFLYPNRVEHILEDLSMFEKLTGAKCSFCRYKFWILFLLFGSSYVISITIDTIVWTKAVGFQIYKYYVGRNVQFLQVDAMVLLEMWLCLELWSRFKALNKHLRLCIKRAYLGTSVCNIFSTTKKLDGSNIELKVLKIRKLKRLHNFLCDTLESFNLVFGPLILLETISAISLIVQYTLVFVYYMLINYKYSSENIGVNGLIFVIDNACYVFALLLSSVYSFIAAINGNQDASFEDDTFLIAVADEVFQFFLMITIITSIVFITLLYPNRVLRVLEDLDIIEEMLRIKCSVSRYKFWILFILFGSSYMVTITFDALTWTNAEGLEILKFYIGRNIQFLQVDMLVLLELWLCLEVWSRFKALNNSLKFFNHHAYLGVSNTALSKINGTITDWRILKIRKLKRLHNLLCDTLQSFNGVFGPVILLEVISAITLTVEYTLIYVYYFVIHYKSGTSMSFAVNGLLFIIQSVIELFALAAVGQLVYQEAHDTIAICYRSINELEARDQPGFHFIKKELQDFIQQVHIRNPKVAASSFFDAIVETTLAENRV
nr:unnamed protein product [Callosobruchus chinensis]